MDAIFSISMMHYFQMMMEELYAILIEMPMMRHIA
jgi:hypothetical protein